MSQTRELKITSQNYTLSGQIFYPEDPPKAAYVLHPATGVPAAYYQKFAGWVTTQGFAILTYDYRSDATVKGSKITMSDWGVHDQNAALNALIATFPNTEIRVIGHSLGGFMTMFHEQAGKVSSLSAVCSGLAYWPRSPFPKSVLGFLFWHVLGPISTWINGSLPARLLGASQPTPSAAFFEWRRWCTNRYLHKPFWGKTLPQPDLAQFSGRLNLVAVSDDWMIPPACVADLAPFYPAAQSAFQTVSPRDAGVTSIGHISVFRPKAAAIWPELL